MDFTSCYALVTHFCYAKTATPQPPRGFFTKTARNDDLTTHPQTPSAREGAFLKRFYGFRARIPLQKRQNKAKIHAFLRLKFKSKA